MFCEIFFEFRENLTPTSISCFAKLQENANAKLIISRNFRENTKTNILVCKTAVDLT